MFTTTKGRIESRTASEPVLQLTLSFRLCNPTNIVKQEGPEKYDVTYVAYISSYHLSGKSYQPYAQSWRTYQGQVEEGLRAVNFKGSG